VGGLNLLIEHKDLEVEFEVGRWNAKCRLHGEESRASRLWLGATMEVEARINILASAKLLDA
jgi:hypothetical protein